MRVRVDGLNEDVFGDTSIWHEPAAPVAGGRRISATRIVASTLGVLAGLLGLEHGWFETLQGNVAPDSVVINAIGPPCERATAWHGCEPALTVVPSFLVTGVLAMAAAATVLFLVGGGFFTMWYGVIAGIAGVKIGTSFTWWRAHADNRVARMLAGLWPCLLIGYLVWDVVAWLIGTAFGDFMLRITPLTTAATPVVLILILLSGFARDTQPSEGSPWHT